MPQISNWVVQFTTKTITDGVPRVVYNMRGGAGNLIVSGEGISWPSIEDMKQAILSDTDKVQSVLRIALSDAFVNDTFSQTEWDKISTAPFGIRVNNTTAKVNF